MAKILKGWTVLEYRAHSAVSQSDLGFLEISPQFYRSVKMEGGDGITSSGFRLGSLLDVLVLTPNDFKTIYVVQPICNAPSSDQQKGFVAMILEGVTPVDAWSANYSTKNKKPEAIATAAAALLADLSEYIEFAKTIGDREVITQEDYDKAVQMRASIARHPLANEVYSPATAEKGRQVMVEWEHRHVNHDDVVFTQNMKGMIDILNIDALNKVILLGDLKTTGRSWLEFRDAAKKYGYPRQLATYKEAVEELLITMGENLDEWEIHTVLFVCQSKGLFEFRAIELDEDDLLDPYAEYCDLIERLAFHQSTGNWDLTREAINNSGVEPWNQS
jgi:hypothetical protein